MRDRLITRLRSEQFDLLVIGGGATGAGIALDAASRGLSVALLERVDFSEGTSSRSTKLLHGGVRYLELAVKKLDRSQFNLVRDALHERFTVLRLAPHLSRPFPLITPLYSWFGLPYYAIGLKMYDWFSGRNFRIGASTVLSRAETLRRLPGLRAEGLRGSVLYYDGQFDDSRLNVALIRTAVQHGALAVSHLNVTGLLHEDGKVAGAQFRDAVTGATGTVRARAVINATGPFVDELRQLDEPGVEPLLTASSGTHIVLKGGLLTGESGMLIPKTDDGRVLFMLPWHGHTLVGTTDNPAVAQADPVAPEDDIDYLLDYLGRYLERNFSRSDVLSAWTGFRPLLRPSRDVGTAQITRDHHIEASTSGLVTVTGGKWTTYRHMAADALERAIAVAGLQPERDSITAGLQVVGAEGFTDGLASTLAREHALAPEVAEHLAHAYGGEAGRVLALAERHELTGRLHERHPYLEAEVIFARDEEFAVTADDVLERRLRLAFVDRAAAEAVRARVAQLLAS